MLGRLLLGTTSSILIRVRYAGRTQGNGMDDRHTGLPTLIQQLKPLRRVVSSLDGCFRCTMSACGESVKDSGFERLPRTWSNLLKRSVHRHLAYDISWLTTSPQSEVASSYHEMSQESSTSPGVRADERVSRNRCIIMQSVQSM